jgi:hypothetical protein
MVASDAQRLEALWADPSRLTASDMPWLASLVEANPAAVPVWWLYLRAVQKAESPQFTQVLHRCAALSPNRAALMAWVEEPLKPVGSLVSGDSLLVAPVSGDSLLVSPVSSDSLLVAPVSSDSLLVPTVSGDSLLVSPVSSDSLLVAPVSSDPLLVSPVSSDSLLVAPVSGDSLLVPPVSGDPLLVAPVSGDPLLVSPVSSDSSRGLNQELQETINEKPQETSNEKPLESSNEKPAIAEKEPLTRPEPKATNAATLNLDALPERVREQILRARAARAQLAEVGFGTAPSEPKVEPVAMVPPKVEPVAMVPPKVEPMVDVSVPEVSTPEPQPAAPVVRTSQPTATKPKQQAAQADKVANEPTSPKDKPANEPTSPSQPTSPKVPSQPTSPTSPSQPTSPKVQPANLSPFAQFVANLEASKSGTNEEALIDQFLAVNPRISPLSKDAPSPTVRTEPDAQVTGLVTETLARMYAEQGHVAKAIQAYEILKLRVPEKSSIFAARIEALKTK